jgi:hypothetical protein
MSSISLRPKLEVGSSSLQGCGVGVVIVIIGVWGEVVIAIVGVWCRGGYFHCGGVGWGG